MLIMQNAIFLFCLNANKSLAWYYCNGVSCFSMDHEWNISIDFMIQMLQIIYIFLLSLRIIELCKLKIMKIYK